MPTARVLQAGHSTTSGIIEPPQIAGPARSNVVTQWLELPLFRVEHLPAAS